MKIENTEENESGFANWERMLSTYNKLKKKHWITLLLCLTAGWTGAHRFYLGDNKIGILYLVFGVPIFFAGVYNSINHLLDFTGLFIFEKISLISFGIMSAIIFFELYSATSNTEKPMTN